jgi:predicted PurR-regulated permease PerM
VSIDGAPRSGRFKFAPILTATVLTVLLLWLFKTVANVFVLLLMGVLVSLYLRALADWIESRTHAPERLAFLAAVLGTVGALVLL